MHKLERQRFINVATEAKDKKPESLEDLEAAISNCDCILRFNPHDNEIWEMRDEIFSKIAKLKKQKIG